MTSEAARFLPDQVVEALIIGHPPTLPLCLFQDTYTYRSAPPLPLKALPILRPVTLRLTVAQTASYLRFQTATSFPSTRPSIIHSFSPGGHPKLHFVLSCFPFDLTFNSYFLSCIICVTCIQSLPRRDDITSRSLFTMALDRDSFNRQSFGPSLYASVKQVRSSHFFATRLFSTAFTPRLFQAIAMPSHRTPTIATSPSEFTLSLLLRAPLDHVPNTVSPIATFITH